MEIGELAVRPDAQIVLVESADIAAIVAPVLTDQVVCTWEQGEVLDCEIFAGRDVICLGVLPLAEIWAVYPQRLRHWETPDTENFTVAKLKAGMVEYNPESSGQSAESVRTGEASSSGPPSASIALSKAVPDDPPEPEIDPEIAELHVKLREALLSMPEAEFRKAWAKMGDDEKRTVGDAGFQRFAAIELSAMYAESHVGQALNAPDADLQAVLGDSSTEDIGEPPEYLEDGPDSHLPRLNGHGNGDKSAISPYSADYWDLPIDIFSQSKPPTEFDTSVFTGDLGFIDTFCSDLSELKGTDYGIAALSAIVSLSAWVHESWLLQVKSRDTTWREAARLWAFICGDSSDGKSVGLALATKPARDLDSIAGKEAAVALAKYASDLRVHEKQVAAYEKRASENTLNPGETMPQPPDRIEIDKRLFTSATPEGLRLLLETTPKGWLYADELSAWAANMGKYSAQKDASIGERSQWLQAWDGGAQSILRGAKPIHIDSWSSCILGGVTDSSIRSSLGGGKLTGDGLIQRFMLVHTRHQRPDIDHEQDADALATMKKTLSALRYMRPDHDKPLRLSPDAYQYFRGFMERLEQYANSGMYPATCQSHILKYRSNAVRIALTLHLAMRGATGTECAAGEYVELPILKMACDICEQLIPHTIYFWESVIGEGKAEIDADMYRVCELICCWHLDGDKLTQSDIGSSFKDWRKPSYEVRKKVSILAALQGMNWIRPYPGSRQLSPGMADSYKLHPALRRMFDQHPVILNARIRRLADGAKFRAMRAENQGLQ